MIEGHSARLRERRPWQGAAFVLGADLCWGLSSTLAKLLFNRDEVTPAALTTLRVSISFLLLLAVLGPRRGPRLQVRREDLPLLCAVGWIGFAVNGYCYYATLSLTNVATAILLTYLAPVFIALYEGLVVGRWPSRSTLGAIAVAVGGCFILVGGYNPRTLRLNLRGLGFGLTTAGAFAAYTVTSQRVLRRYDAWTVLLYGFGIAALTWWVALPPWSFVRAGYSAWLWVAFMAVAVGGTVLPHALFLGGLTRLSATHATILSTMEPVIAAAVAYLVLGETMAPPQYAGGLLILMAVIFVQLWPGEGMRRGVQKAPLSRL